MSNYKIFRMFDFLSRDAGRAVQHNIDDDAAQHISATDEASLRSTTDYYPVIARGVSMLPNNTREARQALYDRAWVALAAHLLIGVQF